MNGRVAKLLRKEVYDGQLVGPRYRAYQVPNGTGWEKYRWTILQGAKALVTVFSDPLRRKYRAKKKAWHRAAGAA